jgi:hypothetical protein
MEDMGGMGSREQLIPKESALRRISICYEPSVSDTSKKRGFDFHIFTWDM